MLLVLLGIITLVVAVLVGTMLLSDDDEDEPAAPASEIALEAAGAAGSDPFTRDMGVTYDADQVAAAGDDSGSGGSDSPPTDEPRDRDGAEPGVTLVAMAVQLRLDAAACGCGRKGLA